MPECIKYYKEERNKQAQLVLHPVVAMVGQPRSQTGPPNGYPTFST